MLGMEGYKELSIAPRDLGLQEIPVKEISGGTREEIYEKGVRGLRGEDRSSAIFIALNAGIALYVAGEVGSIVEGFERSLKEIFEGRAWKKLESIVNTARRLVGVGRS
jgi:anthranilate phosphoribosyltransferase